MLVIFKIKIIIFYIEQVEMINLILKEVIKDQIFLTDCIMRYLILINDFLLGYGEIIKT